MRWPVQTFRRTTWKLVCCPCYFSPYCPYNTSSLVIGNCLYFLIEFICINLSERNLFTERWLLKFDGRDRAEQSRHRHAGRQQHQRPPWQWWNKPYCWTFWSWNRVLIARTRRRMRKRRHRGDHPNISNSKLVPMAGWQGGGLLLVLWWLLLLFYLYLLFARPVQPTTSRRTSENEDHVELQIHTLWTWGFIHIFMQIFGDRPNFDQLPRCYFIIRTMKCRYAMSAAITGKRKKCAFALIGKGEGGRIDPVTCILHYPCVSSGILLFVCIINSNSGRVTLLCAEFIGNLSVFFSRTFCSIGSGHWYGLLLSMSTRSARKLQ